MAGIRVGTTTIKKVMLGTTPAKKVMFGTTLIWQATVPTITKDSDPYGEVNDVEPAPSSVYVSTTTVTIGGEGLTSVTWSRVSGDVFDVNTTSAVSAWFGAEVAKNTGKSAVYRATGNNGLYIDVNVDAFYTIIE